MRTVEYTRSGDAQAYATTYQRHRDLIAAVIAQAVQDATPSRSRHGQSTAAASKSHREAVEWFRSSNHAPFTFLWCCAQLDLDAATIKAKVFA